MMDNITISDQSPSIGWGESFVISAVADPNMANETQCDVDMVYDSPAFKDLDFGEKMVRKATKWWLI